MSVWTRLMTCGGWAGSAAVAALAIAAPLAGAQVLADQSDARAIEIAKDATPALFAPVPTKSLPLSGQESLVKYLDERTALIKEDSGRRALVTSVLPLVTGEGDEREEVDVRLEQHTDHFEPAVGLVETELPRQLSDGLSIGGLGVRFTGAVGEVRGEQVGQQVFYPNAFSDTDVSAMATEAGAETFLHIRSSDSPTRYALRFDLPSNTTLKALTGPDGRPSGWLGVMLDGRAITLVQPISAIDADGAPVKVDTSVTAAGLLTLDVPHDATSKYPLLVDPIIEDQFNNPNASNSNFKALRGWVRGRSGFNPGAMVLTPEQDNPGTGGSCPYTVNAQGQFVSQANTLCIGSLFGANYGTGGATSTGAWGWRPPGTKSYVYRMDMRGSFLPVAGSTSEFQGGLFNLTRAGGHVGRVRVKEEAGANGPFTNAPYRRNFPVGGSFTFALTACIEDTCNETQTDQSLAGTYAAFSMVSSGSQTQAAATGMGAKLYIQDLDVPSFRPLTHNVDLSKWYASQTVRTDVYAEDQGVGVTGISFGVPQAGGGTLAPYIPDGCTGAYCDGPFSTSYSYSTASMPETSNTVAVGAFDNLGKTSATSYTVKVDRTTPTISGVTGSVENRSVPDGSYTLAISGQDRQPGGGTTVSGVRSFEARVDNGTWTAFGNAQCTAQADCAANGTQNYTVDTSSLGAGPHTVSFRATDSAGNVTPETAIRTVAFKVDKAPPTLSVGHGAPLTTWFGRRTLSVTATATDDVSGVRSYSSPSGLAFGSNPAPTCDATFANACPASPPARTLTYTTDDLAEGTASPASLIATDAVGKNSAPQNWAVKVDRSPPTTTLSGPLWDARDTYVTAPSLTLTATSTDVKAGQNRSGVQQLTLLVDDQVVGTPRTRPCASSATEPCDLSVVFDVDLSALGSGAHVVAVRSSDLAAPANSAESKVTVYIDKTPPIIADVTHMPAVGGWRDNVTTPTRSATATATDSLSGIRQFTLTLPGLTAPQNFPVTCTTGPQPCPRAPGPRVLQYDTSGLPEGRNQAELRAGDAAANGSAAAVWPLWIDRTPPTVTYSGALTQQVTGQQLIGGSANLRVDATDAHSGTKQIVVFLDGQELSRKNGTCTSDGCEAALSHEVTLNSRDLPAGPHTVRVETSDQVVQPADRHTTAASYTFTNTPLGVTDQNAPVSTLGFEDWQTYDDLDTGAGSAALINLHSGNALWTHELFDNPGRGLSTRARLTYNSQEPGGLTDGALAVGDLLGGVLAGQPISYNQAGRGFSPQIAGVTRVNQPLQFVQDVPGVGAITEIRLADGDGTRHAFKPLTAGSQVFQGPPGTYLRLRRYDPAADAQYAWVMTRPDGVSYFFDTDGYQTRVADRSNNFLDYSYRTLDAVAALRNQCGVLNTHKGLPSTCNKQLTAVNDAAATGRTDRSVTIDYVATGNNQGLMEKITDHAGRVTRFVYDDQRRLNFLDQALGSDAARRFVFGSYVENTAYLGRVSDPRNNQTTFRYETPGQLSTALRRAVGFVDRRGRTRSLSYATASGDDATRETTVVDEKQRRWRYGMDDAQRLVRVVDPRQKTDTWQWQADVNQQTRHIEAAGTPDAAETNWEWGSLGQKTAEYEPHTVGTKSSARKTTYDYRTGPGVWRGPADGDGDAIVYDLTKKTPPKGGDYATTYFPNAQGQIEKVCEPETGPRCQQYTFSATGDLLIGETDAQGNQIGYFDHDPNGLPTRKVDQRGKTWQMRYDSVGNLLAVRDPRNPDPLPADARSLGLSTPFTARSEYDALDRRTSTTLPKVSAAADYATSRFSYDANDNQTLAVDGEGAEWRSGFTTTDQVEWERSPAVTHDGEDAAAVEETRYEQDETDQVVTERRPQSKGGDGYLTRSAYDSVDQLVVERRITTEANPPSGISQLVTSWAYDLRGNTTGQADPAGNAQDADAAAAVNASNPAKQRYAWTYDVADRKESQTEDPDGLAMRSSWTYDDHDLLATETSPRGNKTPQDGDFRTTYSYDRRDLRATVTDPLSRVTRWDRREDGRVTAVTSPRGTETAQADDFQTSYTYDPAGDLRSVTEPRQAGQYGGAFTVSYDRNEVGDPILVTDGRGKTIANSFLDTGQLRTTDRPSWWIYDAQSGEVRERTPDDPAPSEAAGDLPDTPGSGDFGAVTPQRLPDALPRSGSTLLGYDDEFRLEYVQDVAGKRQDWDYDAAGRMVEHALPYRPGDRAGCDAGEPAAGPIVMRYRYDRNGNQTAAVDGRCNTTRMSYDQFDRLTSTDAPAGTDGSRAVTGLKYDRNSNPIRRSLPRDPSRAVEELSYDAADRLATKVEPYDDGEGSPRNEWRYRYDENGNQVREEQPRARQTGADPNRYATISAFDAADQLDTVTDGDGEQIDYDYDADGNQTKVDAPGAQRDPSGQVLRRVTRRAYDGRGLPWIQTNGTGADARTTITEYDANRNLTRTVNPRGVDPGASGFGDERPAAPDPGAEPDAFNAAARDYDDENQLVTVRKPWAGSESARWHQTFTYDKRGWPEDVSEVFNATDRPAARFVTAYRYYDNGWIRQSTDKTTARGAAPYDQTFNYEYDQAGNQTSWSSKGGTRKITRTFRPDGQMARREAIRTDRPAENRSYDYAYNAAGETTQIKDNQPPRTGPAGAPGSSAARVTSIRRDVAGRPVSINESWDGGRDTLYSWQIGGLADDVRVDGRLTPAGDFVGGRRMDYEYDNLDRLTDVKVNETGSSDVRATRLTYWPSNERRRITKTNATVEERYQDTAGRLSARTVDSTGDNNTKSYEYAYDANENRTSDERGSYAYNARDQLTKWTHPGKLLSGSGDSGVYSEKDPRRVIDYTPAGDGSVLTRRELQQTSAVTGTTRDRITVDTQVSNDYDGDRLIETTTKTTSTAPDVPGATPVKDNRTSRYDYSVFGSQLTTRTRKFTGENDTTTGETGFKQQTQNTYDSFERLLSVRDDTNKDGEADGAAEVYCYDAMDRRDRKVFGVTSVPEKTSADDSFAAQREACVNGGGTTGETRDYSYLGSTEALTREGTADGQKTYDYTADGERLGQRARAKETPTGVEKTAFRPYEMDAQGSTIAVEGESTGAEDTDRYQLDPFGATRNEEDLDASAKTNPFRFQGHYLDPAAGTYDMQARSYRPDTGRFLTQDRYADPSSDLALQSDPSTNNRYAFLGGDPVTQSEYDGHRIYGAKGDDAQLLADVTANGGAINGSGRPAKALQTQARALSNRLAGNTIGRIVDGYRQREAAAVAARIGAAQAAVRKASEGGWRDAAAGFAHGTLGVDVGGNKNSTEYKVGDKVAEYGGYAAMVTPAGAFRAAAKQGLKQGLKRGTRRAAKEAEDRPRALVQSCGHSFLAGTLVLMADGTSRAIESLQAGETVLASDPLAHTQTARLVLAPISSQGDKQIVHLRTDSGLRISSTGDHPYWVNNRDGNGAWTYARDLRAGDQLVEPGHSVETVSSVSVEQEWQRTYNLSVDQDHTYYVGRPGAWVLVHNEDLDDCPIEPGIPNAATRNPAQDKLLTKRQIKELKAKGIDPHDLKEGFGPPSHSDLYRDPQGNVYVKPKGGAGEGDPTGVNLNE